MKIECPECEKLFNQKDMIAKQYIFLDFKGQKSKNVEIKYCKKCYKIVKKEYDAFIKSAVDNI